MGRLDNMHVSDGQAEWWEGLIVGRLNGGQAGCRAGRMMERLDGAQA